MFRAHHVLLAAALAGCGARTRLREDPPGGACGAVEPTCERRSDDPCGPWELVAATCDASSHDWACPVDARVHSVFEEPPPTCLPFHDQPGITAIGGTFVRVPTDDDRCLWIADDVSLVDGTTRRNLAFEVDPEAAFGTCPATSISEPLEVVALAGGDDPNLLVQINGGYRLGGRTHVLYRLFGLDATAPFGVVELGSGVAHWDPGTHAIVVPGPAAFPWGLDLDLGDAVLVSGDHALVWGCPGPPEFLTEGCVLARLAEDDSVEIFSKSLAWIASTKGADAATAFDSGPWVSSVVAKPAGGFRHVYAVGFGSTLETHEAALPTGPWTKGGGLGSCVLPSADPKAYCAGPVVHEELTDPTQPGRSPITYGVGTTGMRTGNPDDYWPRLVWVE